MNVLSLFDGISCAYEALLKAKKPIGTYYASEIDKNAIKVSTQNHPDIVRLGDVREITAVNLPAIDLLIGGSPCQDLSIAKKDRKGLEGDRSSLFWDYVRLKNELNPKYFILENVASMPLKDKDIITEALGVQPVLFNASLVSAQSRKRLFWTNIKFDLPEDKGIVLKDILESNVEINPQKTYTLTATTEKAEKARKKNSFVQLGYIGSSNASNVGGQALRVYDTNAKSTTSGVGLYQHNEGIRKLTPIECERLMGLPDNYTQSVAMTNRYKCVGNAFHVDVVAHILSSINQI